MPYAAVSDVRALAPYVPITPTSQPNQDTVASWIGDVESMLNSTLTAIGYPVPLVALPGKSTAGALTILKQMVAHAVMAMVMRARPNPEQDPANFQKYFDNLLKALRDPREAFILPDVVTSEELVLKESPIRVSSNLTDDLSLPPRVSRDQVF